MMEHIGSLQQSHLPGCHLGGGAQHGLQELEQLTQHKDGLPSHHLLAEIGDVGRLYAARLPKPLRQWLRPSDSGIVTACTALLCRWSFNCKSFDLIGHSLELKH